MKNMDYEKKYNEALNWMRELYPGLHDATKEDAEHYFPELKESEDEKIRKRIHLCLDECVHSDIIRDYERDECLAYLKKQKEQKPSIKIDQLKSLMLQYLQEASNEKEDSDIEADTDKWARKILGYDFEQKPAEWSEEDEKMKDYIIHALTNNTHAKEQGPVLYAKEIAWLKSLKNRGNFPKSNTNSPSEWSEEDKEMLGKVLECIRFAEDHYQLEQEETNGVAVKSWLLDHIIPKPKQEWSEEDEHIIGRLRSIVQRYAFSDNALDVNGEFCEGDYAKLDEWLKSLPGRFSLQPQAKQEQKPEAKLTGWVARDSKYNSYFGLGLVLFKGKPRRSGECWSGAIAAQLPWELFPDLKWMNEPMEVEITITKK